MTIEEIVGANGFTQLKLTVTVDESGGIQADLRGVFFDVGDESVLSGLSATGGDVTDQQFKANKVKDLGNGANMNGSITKGGKGFDGGVEIGSQGIGKNDINSTMFVLALDVADLTLEALAGERIGRRYTSVGEEGNRDASLKLAGEIPDPPNPPVANDNFFYVEAGDPATVDVLANDSVGSGTIDPTTLAFSGAAEGTAANSGGQLLYIANSIVYDTVNSSVDDDMTYTFADDQGNPSNAANVTAKVIDPLQETALDSQAAANNNQLISLSLSTEDRTFNDSSFAEVEISFGPLVQSDVNISFVIDGSISIGASDYAIQVAAVQETIDSLRA